MEVRAGRTSRSVLLGLLGLLVSTMMSGCALFYGSDRSTTPAVAIYSYPLVITLGSSANLTVTALNVSQITVTGSDGSSFTLPATGGTQAVTPTKTTKYTATAVGKNGTATATISLLVTTGTFTSIDHVVFLLQENHTFDNYFGMLNPYRHSNNLNVGDDGVDYEVDGIDDKLTKISNQNDEGKAYSPVQIQEHVYRGRELGLAGKLRRRQPI